MEKAKLLQPWPALDSARGYKVSIMEVSYLATKYGIAKLTISTILKHKEAIKNADVAECESAHKTTITDN
ncbi:hypothetical protein QTO34_007972 [Cnephaeus nilssonii]|uniref:Uncharacterized protein n=1 Tax=Cnephaeus nilssonii TaxID=3371016 RepID=A0AA40I9D6_CNENI|nr:hypothetical protein QTO34_007972 [Eptesicus nilssonii]